MTNEQLALLLNAGSTIGTAISAFGTLFAVYIAQDAAKSWRRGIAQNRSDECVAAIHNCAALVGRVVALKQKALAKDVWPALTDAWRAWGQFRTTYEVMKHHKKGLSNDVFNRGEEVLASLEEFCHKESPSVSGADINKEFGDLTYTVAKSVSLRKAART